MSIYNVTGTLHCVCDPDAQTVSRRSLKFADGIQVVVTGLTEILTELFFEGRQPNKETTEEIIKRLEAKKNYVPSSESVRREYAHLLLKKYQEHIECQADRNP